MVTVPVGVPLPGLLAVTVAVKVTLRPYTTVDVDVVTLVEVGSCIDRLRENRRTCWLELLVPGVADRDRIAADARANAVVV